MEEKQALSLLYLPAAHFNVPPVASLPLPVTPWHPFPLAPFHILLYMSNPPSPTCRKFALVERAASKRCSQLAAAKLPRPQLAGIQLSGSEKRKRGWKSLTSHMVPSSAGASPLRGQMANSYISSTLLISRAEMENIYIFTTNTR